MIKWILIGLFVVIVAIAILIVAIINDADGNIRTMIEGIIFIGLSIFLFGPLGYQLKTENDINKTIKDTLKANYDNVTNYHDINDDQSFVADGLKYSFDYDKDTKTLTVFTDTKSSVDAVFVDGVKQDANK